MTCLLSQQRSIICLPFSQLAEIVAIPPICRQLIIHSRHLDDEMFPYCIHCQYFTSVCLVRLMSVIYTHFTTKEKEGAHSWSEEMR